MSELLNTPVLYVEESIKTTRSCVVTKYDTDWRIYIIFRYGKYLFLGSRKPSDPDVCRKHKQLISRSEKKKNKKVVSDIHSTENVNYKTWPVISMSFNYPSELYGYITSLFGKSKVNTTLYVSPKPIVTMDEIFVHPSHDNMRIMDNERKNRKMELVGYDRVHFNPLFFNESPKHPNILKQMIINLDIMGSGPSGMGLSFTCNSLESFRHICHDANDANYANDANDANDVNDANDATDATDSS